MGTGGATTLLSPEPRSACAARLWCVIRDSLNPLHRQTAHRAVATTDSGSSVHDSHFQRAADSLASTYRKRFTCFKASFCFEIFHFPLLLRTCSEQRIGKVKDQAERVISTPELNTLLCLHPEPINVVVYHDPSGRSHLGIGLALRCFQRLSFPNIATQHCR